MSDKPLTQRDKTSTITRIFKEESLRDGELSAPRKPMFMEYVGWIMEYFVYGVWIMDYGVCGIRFGGLLSGIASRWIGYPVYSEMVGPHSAAPLYFS